MLKNFPNIPVELPELATLKRMGYNRHLTGIETDQAAKIQRYISDAYDLCSPCGRYLRLHITKQSNSSVTLNTGEVIHSQSVATLLANSTECVLLTAKADSRILTSIESFIKDKNGVGALIYDAVASETVDACLGWMTDRLGMEISRFGQHVTSMRYSAGYGDFPLENQQLFYNSLKMNELNVTINENFIFTPEKTVTALCGIE